MEVVGGGLKGGVDVVGGGLREGGVDLVGGGLRECGGGGKKGGDLDGFEQTGVHVAQST